MISKEGKASMQLSALGVMLELDDMTTTINGGIVLLSGKSDVRFITSSGDLTK